MTLHKSDCDTCHDWGMLDLDTFCHCLRGIFFEEKHQREQAALEHVAILCNEIDIKLHHLEMLSNLPFYDGLKITDDTDYDDRSDDGYYSDDEYCSGDEW